MSALTPAEALIAELRRKGDRTVSDWATLLDRAADALEAALSAHPAEETVTQCGCDLSGMYPPAVHIVDRHPDPIPSRGAHPAEETDWEYRRVTPAGNPRRDAIFESPPDLDEGWTMERRAVGPWEPVPSPGTTTEEE